LVLHLCRQLRRGQEKSRSRETVKILAGGIEKFAYFIVGLQ